MDIKGNQRTTNAIGTTATACFSSFGRHTRRHKGNFPVHNRSVFDHEQWAWALGSRMDTPIAGELELELEGGQYIDQKHTPEPELEEVLGEYFEPHAQFRRGGALVHLEIHLGAVKL